MEGIRVKDLPRKGRPYEECLRPEPDGLSDAGLLTAILHIGGGEGNSLNLVDSLLALGNPRDGLLGLLHHFLDDFIGTKGVREVKGVQLLCIEELSKRIWKRKVNEHALYFGHPEKISDYYMEDICHLEQEEIRIVFLNTKQTTIRDQIVTKGAVDASVMTSREVLTGGLRYRAISMVLAHGHPSGDPTPNRTDILLTKYLKKTGEPVRITLIDHAIIGDRRYPSFREEGLM